MPHEAAEQVAGEDRKRNSGDEQAIDRPPEIGEPRHVLEHQGEQRRVTAEREQHRQREDGGPGSRSALDEDAAADAEDDQQDDGDGAEEGVVEAVVGGRDLRRDRRLRTPIAEVHHVERAEHVGHGHRQQAGGMQRRLQRGGEVQRRAVGQRGELHRQQQRRGEDDDAGQPHQRKAAGALPQIAERAVGDEDVADGERQQHEAEQQRDLVAAERDHRGDHGESDGKKRRSPLERQLQHQHGQRKQAVAQDDAGVVEPARGRAAEHEYRGGEDRGGGRPAAAVAIAGQGQPADQQVRIDDEIERAHGGRGIDRRPQQEQRREDQRLRIGDAGMAAIVIGVPERRGAVG